MYVQEELLRIAVSEKLMKYVSGTCFQNLKNPFTVS